MVVLVVHIGLFGMHPASSVGCLVQTESTRAGSWDSLGTAIACEVALLEDLDEGVFTVALDRAGIAYTSGCPLVVVFGWRGIASQASKNGLSQRSEDFGACVNTLKEL